MKKAKVLSIKDLCLISLFIALITVCSWISIPLAIPVTLQIFAIFFASAYLGLKRGVLCVLAYILLGAVGVPVFSGFRGGIGHIFTHTGGFIIGFLLSAFIIGFLLKKKGESFKSTLLAMILALLGCYLVESVWIVLVSADKLNADFVLNTFLGLIPLLFCDFVKALAAAFLVLRLKKIGDTAIK